MFNIGSQLRKARKTCNLTLDQLAASSGVDRGTISRIELGHVSPRIDTIGFLCEAMGTNLSSFFGLPDPGALAEPATIPVAAGLRSPEPFALPEAPLADLGRRTEFPFPLEGAAKPALDGYWPVPSSFWKGLLEVLERFEILLKNSREMILVKDPAGTILYTSPPCEQILGFRPQDLVGQKVRHFIHPEDLPAFDACLEALAATSGDSRSLDYRMRRKDDSWCWISSKLTNQLNNPSIRAVVMNALQIQAP